MQLSYKELQKLGIKLPIEQLEPRMFQLGHEVEEIDNINIEGLIVGQIEELEKHPQADTLNVCQVNTGKEKLQIVCGAPNTYVGQKVIVSPVGTDLGYIVIQKTDLRGVESNGMICALSEIGYSAEKLPETDSDGIYDVPQDIEIGTNAMEVLNLNDKVMDVSTTANRGDCQSYRGMYNDIRAVLAYNEGTTLPEFPLLVNTKTTESSIDTKYPFTVNEQYVPYFSTQYIEGVNVEETNLEDKLFLVKQGFKVQNSITDISNKILMETGIPSHIYDADKIKGQINIDLTTTDETFVGLDGKEIDVPVGTLVIRDEEKIISLAGVMGSESTKVDGNTKNVLIEVGEFVPNLVFRSTKVLGRKTEASLRYEKGIDTTILKDVSNLLVEALIKANPNAKVGPLVVDNTKKRDIPTITLKLSNVKRILGIEVPKADIIKIFEVLNFEVTDNGEEISVVAPYYRYDMSQENDLIEEIIRIYDVDKIPVDETINTFVRRDPVIKTNKYYDMLKVEDILLRSGLNEVVTYSLISEKKVADFTTDFNAETVVALMSPLSSENALYRQTVITSLVESANKNFAYQEKTVKAFEIANTYHLEGEDIKEATKVAALIAGDKENTFGGAKKKYTFADLRSILEELLTSLNVNFAIKQAENTPIGLNPYATGDILIEDQKAGVIGEVVFDYAKKQKEQIFVFEIDFDMLMEATPQKAKYNYVSTLPQIERDFTIEVNEDVTYGEVVEVFADLSYIKDIKLMDIYAGENIEAGQKAITVKVIFKDENETLKKEVVDQEVEKLVANIEARKFKMSK